MRRQRRTIALVRELAERQHGVFSRRQLAELGIGRDLIDHWVRDGRVEIVERGVYGLSRGLLTREGQWMAAVLAAAPDAVLSHRSAAAHWRIRGHNGPTEVTAPRKIKRRRGFLPHCLPIAGDEMTVHARIPITTPARTLFDIASQIRSLELDRAMREADYLRLAGGPSLRELLERYPRKTGTVAVRRMLEAGWSDAPTRGELESRFASFIDKYELPRPERNALIDLPGRRVEVDFLWRSAQLVVELDGYQAHGTRFAFENDREWDRLLQLEGFRVVRATWRHLDSHPARLANDLRELIRS